MALSYVSIPLCWNALNPVLLLRSIRTSTMCNTKSTVVHWHKQMETIVHAIQANPLVHIPFPPSKTQPVFKSSIQRVLRRPLFCSRPFCVGQNCTICPPASDPRNGQTLNSLFQINRSSYHYKTAGETKKMAQIAFSVIDPLG